MAPALFSSPSLTTLTVILVPVMLLAVRFFRGSHAQLSAEIKKSNEGHLVRRSSEAAVRLGKNLAGALPNSIITPADATAFDKSMNAYWVQQERAVRPACVIRPETTEQLSTVVKILKQEYDLRFQGKDGERAKENAAGIFAVRCGGHSPIPRAASIEDGVVVDMSLFNEITPSQDGTSVVLGTGSRWGKVFEVLEAKGLAVAGARNSEVGVGGFILGGGISFHSPRYGFVCSTVISYEVVLADGSITTASESHNADLWCALKGGGNNFGIVTRITLRSFPSSNIWSGFLYMPIGQTSNVLSAFHSAVQGTVSNDADEYATGPMACFTYLQQLGIQAISVNLVYTKMPANPKTWPEAWASTPFKSIFRLWSTTKVRTLVNACDDMASMNPPGNRQVFGTTTIKNDAATLKATHAAYADAIADIKKANVKGMSWTLVLQPFLPAWAQRGDANPLGFQDGATDPLVMVSFTVNWIEQRDDAFVEKVTEDAVRRIDRFAAEAGTGHRYRYMNYCGAWQKPFESYGEDNLRFLQDTSRHYDPDGLFQRGCVGGFKLGFAGSA